MNLITNYANPDIFQNIQNQGKKVEVQPKTNTVEQDAFVKEDKKKDKKKIAKYVAIGTGVAALAYSAFALVKYREKSYLNFSKKLAEPIKTLKARINPYDFKPKTDILENDIDYMCEAWCHVDRLTKNQQKKYVKNLYENINFNERTQDLFNLLLGKFLN